VPAAVGAVMLSAAEAVVEACSAGLAPPGAAVFPEGVSPENVGSTACDGSELEHADSSSASSGPSDEAVQRDKRMMKDLEDSGPAKG